MTTPYIIGGALGGLGQGLESLVALRQADRERADRDAALLRDDERANAWLALQQAAMEDARKNRERQEGVDAEERRYDRYQRQKQNRRAERALASDERVEGALAALREAQAAGRGRPRARTVDEWRGIIRERMQGLLPRDAAGDRETQERILAQVRTEYPDAPAEAFAAFAPPIPTAPAITVTRRAGTPAESTQATGRRSVDRASYDAMVRRYGREQTDRYFQPR